MQKRYTLTGIDSGLYQIRFTRDNCDTVVINDVHHNGLDTIDVRWSEYDRTAYLHSDTIINLLKRQPFVTVESVDTWLKMEYNPYEIEPGNVRIDTLIKGSASFILKVNSADFHVRRLLDAQYAARITSTPILSPNEIPHENDAVDRNNKYTNMGFIFTGKILKDTIDISLRNCNINNEIEYFVSYPEKYIADVNVKEKPQLYLHIIPIWRCLHRDWFNAGPYDMGGSYDIPQGQFRYGSVYTIPIVWQ